MARRAGPERVVYQHGVRLLQRAAQAADILMVVEWVASRPRDQLDHRVHVIFTVVGKGLARVQQHVRDPRHRDELAHRVLALGEDR